MTKPTTKKQLTSELIDVYCKVLDMPSTPGQAAAVIGFSEKTVKAYIAAGEDEDCTDPLLLELARKNAKVMAGGTRAALTKVGMELALAGEPKMLIQMMKYIPNIEPATNIKLEATHELKKEPRNYSALSDAELIALDAMERKMLAPKND